MAFYRLSVRIDSKSRYNLDRKAAELGVAPSVALRYILRRLRFKNDLETSSDPTDLFLPEDQPQTDVPA